MNASAASTHASQLSVNELEKLLVTRKAEEASTHNPGAEDMPSEALLLSTPQRESSLMLSNIAGVTDSLSAIVEKGTVDEPTTPSRRKATSASPIRCSPRRSPRHSPRQKQKSPPPTKAPYNRRTIAEVKAKRKGELPSDFPTGPFYHEAANDAFDAIGAYSRDAKRGGGSWDIRLCGSVAGTLAKGPIKKIVCSKYLKPLSGGEGIRKRIGKGTECKWMVELEECLDENREVCWCIRNFKSDHNHNLAQNAVELMSQGDKHIPKELKDIVDMGKRARLRPGVIHSLLRSEAESLGIDIQFEYNDVYNLVKPSAADIEFDSTNFAEWLFKRRELGYSGYFETDEDGCLISAVWQIEEGLEHYSRNPDKNVIFYDTTHGTNKWKMKLALFTTVSESGETVILAATLIKHESRESFKWAFEMFRRMFSAPPTVIFTDGDPGMHGAIKDVFPESVHLFCTYHLSLNLFTHCHGLFPAGTRGKQNQQWGLFLKAWWTITLKSEESSRAIFDTEWDALLAMLPPEPTTEAGAKKYQDALKWLAKLRENAPQWTARYTWEHRTYGAHSTQRIESVHNAIKNYMATNLLLVDIAEQISSYRKRVEFTAEYKKRRAAIKQSVRTDRETPILQDASTKLEPYAIDLLMAQYDQILMYNAELAPDETDTYITSRFRNASIEAEVLSVDDMGGNEEEVQPMVMELGLDEVNAHTTTHRTTLKKCSCQRPTCFGLPCAHMLRVYLKLEINKL